MSLVLKPLEIANKNELLSLAVGQLKEAPYEFQILDRQVGTRESGFADLVAVNREGELSLIYWLPPNAEAGLLSSLSNYFWACENILNLKKMYPHVSFSAASLPSLVYLSSRFSAKWRKTLSLLKAESLRLLEYRAFEVNGVPCLLFEEASPQQNEGAFVDVEVARLKKEYAVGARFLSEEEILEFLNFEKSLKP